MNSSIRRVSALLPALAGAAALLLSGAGCSPIGCFEASEAGGNCPSRADAIKYFGNPACGGRVKSVDSEASVRNGQSGEGTLCCYSITNEDPQSAGCTF
jgi:hypothetical protein